LVGGASRGLGYACAQTLAVEGVRVTICSRAESSISRAAERIRDETGGQVHAVAADQSTPAGVERMLHEARERFGPIDILVNNTGGPPPGLFSDHDDVVWQAAFEGLILSVVRLCRGVLPEMSTRGWGRIITNTSFTVREPAEQLVLSNALRAAVVALSKTLSREVAASGITVNCVAPGAFDTERLEHLFDAQALAQGITPAEIRQQWVDRIPAARILEPKELAAAVVFLASEQAAAITGVCLPVDGGMLHGLF